MKILFLAHRIPYPPNKGEKIRAYHFLSAMADKHEITLVCWVDDAADLKHVSVLKKICWGGVRAFDLDRVGAMARGGVSLASGRSFSEGYFFSPAVRNEVSGQLASVGYDLAYVFSSPMAQYVKHHRIPTFVDFVDVDSAKWGDVARYSRFPRSAFMALEQRRLARYEVEVSRWARCSLFVSHTEAELFRSIGGVEPIRAIPNGIDTALTMQPLMPARESVGGNKNGKRRGWPRLNFTGTMDYFPNADAVAYFAREILPLIHRKYPEAMFEIVGRNPAADVRDLAHLPGVRVLGEVADVLPFLLNADVSVAPFRIARGLQNKILEAMAAGVPVVATPEAVRAIGAKPDHEVLVGDSPEAFARQVFRLLGDRDIHERIAQNARKKVIESYNWATAALRIQSLIAEHLCPSSHLVPQA